MLSQPAPDRVNRYQAIVIVDVVGDGKRLDEENALRTRPRFTDRVRFLGESFINDMGC